MSAEYGISPRKTDSLPDTFSCIFRGIVSYGTQMTVAMSAAGTAGVTISAFGIIPYLMIIFFIPEKR